MAILLGSWGRGYSGIDSTNALLGKYGTLAGLMNRPLNEVAQIMVSKLFVQFVAPQRMESANDC